LNFQNLKNTDQIGHCNLLKANEMVCKWHALSSQEETTIYLIIYQLIPWASRIKLSSMRIVVLAASPTEDPDSALKLLNLHLIQTNKTRRNCIPH
jgi:hypothetical protein